MISLVHMSKYFYVNIKTKFYAWQRKFWLNVFFFCYFHSAFKYQAVYTLAEIYLLMHFC